MASFPSGLDPALDEACRLIRVTTGAALVGIWEVRPGGLVPRSSDAEGPMPPALQSIPPGRGLFALALRLYGVRIEQRKDVDVYHPDVHYYDIYRQPPERETELGVTYHPTLDSLLAVSQFFSINAPSTPETRYFFNQSVIEKLPHGAVVVNTARGDLVNDEDMIAALKSGRLGYAGLDVFAGEPKINEGYYDLPNTFLFPHLGSAAIEARNQMGYEALDNIDAFFAGKDMPFKLA